MKMHILDWISVLAEVGTAIGTLVLAYLALKAWKNGINVSRLETGQMAAKGTAEFHIQIADRKNE